jgi:hypothetical protein
VSRWTPCKHSGFIRKLRNLGFDGPFSGARHQFMIFGLKRLAIPSNAEYSMPQLRMMRRYSRLRHYRLFHILSILRKP